MSGEIIGAYTYITSEKKGYIRLEFDTSVYDFINPNIPGNIKYRAARIDNNNVYNDNLSWFFPETDVEFLNVLNGGKEIEVVVNNPFLQTRINFYNGITLVKYMLFEFVDNFLNRHIDHFVSVDYEGKIMLWLGSETPKMPYKENLRGKIVKDDNTIFCIVAGRHMQSMLIKPATSSTSITLNNGMDIYNRFIPLIEYSEFPKNGETLYFIYELNGAVLRTEIFYDYETGLFYKPAPPGEEWKNNRWQLMNMI